MSFAVNNSHPISDISGHEDTGELNFNQKVLDYIKNNRPDKDLNELLKELKMLSPNPVTFPKLFSAMSYTSTILRKDPEYSDYIKETFSSRINQAFGVNMFMNNMINDMFYPTDDTVRAEQEW